MFAESSRQGQPHLLGPFKGGRGAWKGETYVVTPKKEEAKKRGSSEGGKITINPEK